jgi:predicted ATPase
MNPQFLAQAGRLPDVSAESVPSGASDEGSSGSRSALSLDYRGEGLASALYFMSETGSPVLESIVGSLQATIDGFEGFEFNLVGTDRVGFSARFKDSRDVVAAANLSDGTLSVMGLTVLLANPTRLPIMCIEEPENGLTPNSTRAVYESMREVAYPPSGTPASQLLISSHSPHVIVEAWNGVDRDFIYQVRPNHGQSQLRPFTDVVAEQKMQLEKDSSGRRTRLNLNVADRVMDGYLMGE